MSNNKNDKVKQKKLTEKQRLKRKNMLIQLKQEIQEIEFQIKHSKISNAKVAALRALKISLRIGQLIAPFAVAAGITVGGFVALGATPFYRDDKKQNLEIMKEFDSCGNIRYEQQYDEYENTKSIISYYSKWESIDNNLYSRNIETYSIGDITEETIIKLVNENNISSLQEILGKPISKKTETRNNLTEEQLVSDSYLQALIYVEEENDYVMVKESFDDNVLESFIWILVTIFVEYATYKLRSTFSSFDFSDCVREIKRKHPDIDTEELVRKLEIKRNNYDRLTR